jgi:hypothetical protein
VHDSILIEEGNFMPREHDKDEECIAYDANYVEESPCVARIKLALAPSLELHL